MIEERVDGVRIGEIVARPHAHLSVDDCHREGTLRAFRGRGGDAASTGSVRRRLAGGMWGAELEPECSVRLTKLRGLAAQETPEARAHTVAVAEVEQTIRCVRN